MKNPKEMDFSDLVKTLLEFVRAKTFHNQLVLSPKEEEATTKGFNESLSSRIGKGL